MYRLRVVVDEIKGFCDLPLSVGDYFEVDGGRLIVPPDKYVCIWALQSLMPFLTAKQRKITEENDWVPTTSKITCPDPNGMVIYRVLRVGVDEGPETDSATLGEPSPFEPLAAGPPDGESSSGGSIPKRILVNKDACTGCRRCELACSLRHDGVFQPETSRITVTKDEAKGLDVPHICRQCGSARCVQACPSGALSRDPLTHAVLVDTSKCIKCGACSRACPFGSIRIAASGYPLICDLCGGSPACVEVCPTAAIHYGRAGDTQPPPKFSQPGKEKPRRAGSGNRTDPGKGGST